MNQYLLSLVDGELEDHEVPVFSNAYFLNRHQVTSLQKQGIRYSEYRQDEGDVVFIPAGWPHQVRLYSCLKDRKYSLKTTRSITNQNQSRLQPIMCHLIAFPDSAKWPERYCKRMQKLEKLKENTNGAWI